MRTSIILPISNNLDKLETFLSKQTSWMDEDCEVLILDCEQSQSSRQITQEIKNSQNSNINVLYADIKELGKAFNLALEKAKGEIVIFIELSNYIYSNFLSYINDEFQDSELGALGGIPTNFPQSSAFAQLTRDAFCFAAQEDNYPHIRLDCAIFRKKALLDAGGFSQEIWFKGYDHQLTLRLEALGYESRVDPLLPVKGPYPETLSQSLKYQFDLAKNYAQQKGAARGNFPWPSGAFQCVLVLLAFGLLGVLGPTSPTDALTLALVCFMLIYYPNRPFLKYLVKDKPEIMGKAILFIFLRPIAGICGLLWGTVKRIVGTS